MGALVQNQPNDSLIDQGHVTGTAENPFGCGVAQSGVQATEDTFATDIVGIILQAEVADSGFLPAGNKDMLEPATQPVMHAADHGCTVDGEERLVGTEAGAHATGEDRSGAIHDCTSARLAMWVTMSCASCSSLP